jgi:hypothetical protein
LWRLLNDWPKVQEKSHILNGALPEGTFYIFSRQAVSKTGGSLDLDRFKIPSFSKDDKRKGAPAFAGAPHVYMVIFGKVSNCRQG